MVPSESRFSGEDSSSQMQQSTTIAVDAAATADAKFEQACSGVELEAESEPAAVTTAAMLMYFCVDEVREMCGCVQLL